MTMQHQIHPDDERLAALAGTDPDAVADAELRAHVTSCARCRDFVDEIATLRTALAELPDLVPSRPLQLLPPVAEPRVAGAGWMRRLAAPIMAGGFGLVLVGAIGTSGVLDGASAGAAPTMEGAMERENGTPLGAAGQSSADMESDPRSRASIRTYAAAPETVGTDDTDHQGLRSDELPAEVAPLPNPGSNPGLLSTSDARMPWLVLIGLGVGLLLAGLYLRFSTQPRAG